MQTQAAFRLGAGAKAEKLDSALHSEVWCSAHLDLLAFTTDLVVPVDEGALRIVAPCPHVEFEEGWKVVAVGAGDEEEGLAFEDGRGGMILQPRCGIDDEFNTDEAEFAMAGFVDEGLRMRCVDFAIANESAVDVVNPHGAVIGSADATEEGAIATGGCVVDVDELRSGFPDGLDQSGWGDMVSVFVLLGGQAGR